MAGARRAPVAGDVQLTPREAEVLQYLRLRLTNREIAERLVVSTRTVESHVSSLLAKLGKTGRRELAETGSTTDAGLPSPSLPVPLDSFVGRSDELDELIGLLRSQRLVTLVGPPGVGKTRLAVEVARRVAASYAGGVRLVELAPVTDEADVADRLLIALGGRQVPGQTALATLGTEARDESLLVLIDNCEHLLPAAAAVVHALFRTWPHTVVLATSREPLHLPGEFVRPVRPLSLPDPAETEPARVRAAESVRLLLDRAGASGAGLSITDTNAAAVALLCRRLDGLPLAVELVAGRLRTLTPDQLADRLDTGLSLLAEPGVGTGDRTLRGAIERSHAGLSTTEAALFASLAVFPGTFALEAVEDVCADAIAPQDMIGTFSTLADRSLVSVVPSGTANRYRLLDTLHAYAAEQLPAGQRERLAARHASYFAALAAEAEPSLHGSGAQEWLSRLRVEQDNLGQALEWALGHQPGLALRLVGALGQFWQDTDQRRSGIEWAERALAVDADTPAAERLGALLAAAILVAPSDARRCAALVAEATVVAREVGDAGWWARTQLAAATSAAYTADATPDERAAAELAARAASSWFRRVGDHWRAAEALTALSLLQSEQDAIVTLADARGLYELVGDELRAANCAYLTASLAVRELDDPRRAQQLAEDALAMAVRVGNEHETAHARSILAEVHLRDGALQLASEVAAECLSVFRRAADHRCVSAMLLLLGTAAARRGEDVTALAHLREALDVARLGAHARTVPLVHLELAALQSRGSGHDGTSAAPSGY
jgi:predicted ATPase/DNA-binding CsgD family transcriptional regulator